MLAVVLQWGSNVGIAWVACVREWGGREWVQSHGHVLGGRLTGLSSVTGLSGEAGSSRRGTMLLPHAWLLGSEACKRQEHGC